MGEEKEVRRGKRVIGKEMEKEEKGGVGGEEGDGCGGDGCGLPVSAPRSAGGHILHFSTTIACYKYISLFRLGGMQQQHQRTDTN